MAYADYNYYTSTFLGNAVPATAFAAVAERASEYVDYITRNKVDSANVPDAVKRAVCALAENYYILDQTRSDAISDGRELKSQTVGSWSRTYLSGSEASEGYEAMMKTIAERYLANTGLLYRGGSCRCRCSHTL